MHVLWIFVIAGARAPVAELASMDVHGNEPDAARVVPWISEMPSSDEAALDAARETFLQHETPSLDVDVETLPPRAEPAKPLPSSAEAPEADPKRARPRLRHPANPEAPEVRPFREEGAPAPVPWSSAELPSLDGGKSPAEAYLQLGTEPAAEPPGRTEPAPSVAPAPSPVTATKAPAPAPDSTADALPRTTGSRGVPAQAPVFLSQPAKPRDEERILELTRDLFVQAPLLFIIPGMAMATIAAVLLVLLRYLRSGLGAVNDWSARLVSRTDWGKLQDGSFVKVVGVAAAPDKHISSPLGGQPCAAYRVSVAYDDGQAWVPLSTSEARTTFHVLDPQGRALLVAENDFHMYHCASQEWTFPAGGCPPEFLALCAEAPACGLRFREEVLALGTKVSCVGAVSRLKLESKGVDSAGAIRPAYAVLMFRDDRIPWAKMTDLAAGDWKQLAARVLVSAG